MRIATQPDELLFADSLTFCSAVAICTDWSEADGYFKQRLLYHMPGGQFGSLLGTDLGELALHGAPGEVIERLILDMESGRYGHKHAVTVAFAYFDGPRSHETVLACRGTGEVDHPLLRLVHLAGGIRLPSRSWNPCVRLHRDCKVSILPDGTSIGGGSGRVLGHVEGRELLRNAVEQASLGSIPSSETADFLRLLERSV